jgi:hypothetical protein
VLRYLLPYLLPFFVSVLLMAIRGTARRISRLLLIGPIFDSVLNPLSQGKNVSSCSELPGTDRIFESASRSFPHTFRIHGPPWRLRWWRLPC